MTTAMTESSHKLNTLAKFLRTEKAQRAIAQVLPRHLKVERITNIALSSAASSNTLLQCTPQSIFKALISTSQLGLETNGPLGHAYLVPFKNKGIYEATPIIGYRGLIDLARRSGNVVSIEAHVVHEKDRFRCVFGLETVLEHEPCWDGDPGPMKAVYAVARIKDGGTQLEVMTKDAVDKIRKRSRASSSGPWVTDYEEMARKTVVRRLCKYLPMSVELAEALTLDNQQYQDEPQIIDLTDAEALTDRFTQPSSGNGGAPSTGGGTEDHPSIDEVISLGEHLAEVCQGDLGTMVEFCCGVGVPYPPDDPDSLQKSSFTTKHAEVLKAALEQAQGNGQQSMV